MATLARRSRRETHAWPGFVDALASLLMVIIFLLMMVSVAHFFLNEALSGRESALLKLENRVAQLADLLALEQNESENLRIAVAELSSNLQSSVAKRDDLAARVQSLTLRAESAEEEKARLADQMAVLTQRAETAESEAERLSGELAQTRQRAEGAETELAALRDDRDKVRADLEDAYKTIEADRETIEAQLGQLAKLNQNVEALTALKAELEQEVARLAAQSEEAVAETEETKAKLLKEEELAESARAQVALLNRQLAALREQLGRLSAALDVSEALNAEQKVQIASLGSRLNAALATKVQELSRYRSEFFGRLREVLGDQQDIRIVGDRFVFQSEVLFGSGSAVIGDEGRVQLGRLANTLREIAGEIPDDIDWILRVDGHTDKLPIRSSRFPSNWELSTARAISVVRFLMDQGIHPDRLAATGFAEYQPLDARDDEIAYRRNRRIELKLTQR